MLLFVVNVASTLQAQTEAEELAVRIATKMKHSLGLSAVPRQQVYDINMRLTSQKQAARAGSTDREAVGKELQQIEYAGRGVSASC